MHAAAWLILLLAGLAQACVPANSTSCTLTGSCSRLLLRDIPCNLSTGITTLDLSSNFLSSFSFQYVMPRLLTLNLRDNRIASIPSGVFWRSSLLSIDLSDNYLRAVPVAVFQATSLQTLNLSVNLLSSIGALRLDQYSLTSVDFSFNPVSQISTDIFVDANFTTVSIRCGLNKSEDCHDSTAACAWWCKLSDNCKMSPAWMASPSISCIPRSLPTSSNSARVLAIVVLVVVAVIFLSICGKQKCGRSAAARRREADATRARRPRPPRPRENLSSPVSQFIWCNVLCSVFLLLEQSSLVVLLTVALTLIVTMRTQMSTTQDRLALPSSWNTMSFVQALVMMPHPHTLLNTTRAPSRQHMMGPRTRLQHRSSQ
eukprot:m.595468 g.595468  ORF g.595468 m.595468 type:complete len:372 (-) comp58041_c0_seq32:345-1460(-)